MMENRKKYCERIKYACAEVERLEKSRKCMTEEIIMRDKDVKM